MAILWLRADIYYDCRGNIGYGSVGVYQLDESTATLSLTCSTTFGGDAFAVQWCQGSPSCQYLAVGGDDDTFTNGILQVFKFDSSNSSLEPIAVPVGVEVDFITSLDWCSSCSYLAAGDYDGIIQVFQFDGVTLSTPWPALRAFGGSIMSNGAAIANIWLRSIILILYTFSILIRHRV